MTLAQEVFRLQEQKEVIELVDSQARAALMDFERDLIEEAFKRSGNQVSWRQMAEDKGKKAYSMGTSKMWFQRK